MKASMVLGYVLILIVSEGEERRVVKLSSVLIVEGG